MKSGGRSRWSLAAVAAVAGIAAFATGSLHARSGAQQPAPAPQQSDAVRRGEYLVKGVGCADCHTPHTLTETGPEPDMSNWLAGHPSSAALPPPPEAKGPWVGAVAGSMTAWSGPWGVSYTANLTPDAETGLGAWTEQQFIDTMRTGRRQGRGRQILPPMPWPAFSNLTDDDLKAIFAYLRSIPPVKNKVPEPIIPTGAQP